MAYNDIGQYYKRKYERINKDTKRKFDKLNKEKLKKEEKNRAEADKHFIKLLRGEKGRANFPQSVKDEELKLSKGYCRLRSEPLKEYQFHHRDFNKSNKSQKNCRVLCCNCHQYISKQKAKGHKIIVK